MKKLIADRTGKIDASGIRKVFSLAATLNDPINFSIGQPDFDVPGKIKAEAIKAIQAGKNKYSLTAGLSQLRARIGGKISAEFGWQKPSVIITSGVSGGLLLGFMVLVNPGDEVIFVDPYFVMYKHLVNMLGGKCVFVDSYPDFGLPAEKIRQAITEKSKLIIVNSPANPTGAVYSSRQLKQLAKIAAENDIPVISDEIYKVFCYDRKFTSIARFYDRTIVLRGFSKSCAMTGWRVGYAAVNESLVEIVEQMTKIQQYTFVCSPTPFQLAATAAVDFDVTEFVDAYRRKRDILYEGLKDSFELKRPAGAFYAFVKAPDEQSATEFVEKAVKNNVLIIPGGVFSEKDTHFRLSYATSDDKIRQGIEVLCRLV